MGNRLMSVIKIMVTNIDRWYQKIQTRMRISNGSLSFLTSMIGFYILHAGFFMKRGVNEDYLHTVETSILLDGPGPQSGRFLGGLLEYLNPWLVGFICAVMLSIAAVLIVKMFNVDNKISIILISLSIISFPTLAPTYGYFFMAQNYSISILCAVLAVFITKKYKFGFLLGSIFLMISLAEYQAYIALTAALCLICLYFDLIKPNCGKNEFLYSLARYLGMGIIGAVVYLITLKLYLAWGNIALADYKGINEMGQINPLDLPKLIFSAYKSFIQFFDGKRFFYLPIFIQLVYVLLAVMALYLIYQNAKRKKIYANVISVILIILFPLCLSIVEIMAPETHMDTLTSYAFVMCIITPLLLVELSKSNLSKFIMGILTICIIVNNGITVGRYYLFLDVVYEQTAAFENRLYARIEQTDGFEFGMPLAMIVDPSSDINTTAYNNNTDFPKLRGERGVWRKYIGLNQDYLRNSNKTTKLLRNMLGADISNVTQEQIDAVMATEDFAQLTAYPAQGSIKVIDGVMVVNFIDHDRLEADDFDISVDENTITLVNNYAKGQFQYAWYIQTETEMIKLWYTDDNTLRYTFDTDGSYSVIAFIRDISDSQNGQSATVCTLEVENGKINVL